MSKEMDDRAYCRHYRGALGFSNQQSAKDYLAAKDITPEIDYGYVDDLLGRLCDILTTVNGVIHESLQQEDISEFCREHVTAVYETIHSGRIIPKLNNQGRRPEQVLYSWLRGYASTRFLQPALANLFGIVEADIRDCGDDDFRALDTFRRTPKADLALTHQECEVVLEVQSGFQGINDIKQHKVLEAKRAAEKDDCATICVHFDMFNGQVAFVRLDMVTENDLHWVTRQQMEGQTVFNIDQDYFAWRIMDPLPKLDELDLGL